MNFKKSSIIKKARKKLGLSLRQFAAKLGISKSALDNYEKGRREPPINVLLKCCDIVGIRLKFRRADDGIKPKVVLPIGKKLSLLRRMKFITIKTLSYRTGIPVWRLYAIESGRIIPSRDEIKVIACGLKVPVKMFRDKNFYEKIKEIKRKWLCIVS